MRSVTTSAAGLAFLLCAGTALAHLPTLESRLVGLVDESELIVVGTTGGVTQAGGTRIRVEVVLDRVVVATKAGAGLRPGRTVSFSAPPGLAPHQRYLLFLRQGEVGWESSAPAGVVFQASPKEDDLYRSVVLGIRSARDLPGHERDVQLRAALLPALRARTPAFRYDAALAFSALVGHGGNLTPQERSAVEDLLGDANADPALRPLLLPLLRATPVSGQVP